MLLLLLKAMVVELFILVVALIASVGFIVCLMHSYGYTAREIIAELFSNSDD